MASEALSLFMIVSLPGLGLAGAPASTANKCSPLFTENGREEAGALKTGARYERERPRPGSPDSRLVSWSVVDSSSSPTRV